MKNKLTTLIIFLLLLIVNVASKAQEVTKLRFGLGLQGATPVDHTKDTHRIGLGADIRLTKGIISKLDATFSAGVTGIFPIDTKSSSKLVDDFTDAISIVPLKVGVRYMLSKNIYATAETGISFVKMSVYSYNLQHQVLASKDYSSTNFSYAAGIGGRFGGFDVGIKYEDAKAIKYLALRLGHDF